jgi:S-DNA-T family DNA segregation ATPase FtsK/SpoIIIE
MAMWAWWCAAWGHGVTYWPELAYLSIGAHHGWVVVRRVLRTVRRWGMATVRLMRRSGPGARRAMVAAGSAHRWWWTHLVCPAVCATARVSGCIGVWCWQRVESPVRDAAGWLVYTAPGVAGRLLLRLASWLPVAVAVLLRHAAVGLGWLLARLVRYCLAYPEYAGIVREARALDRPRRARVAIVAWRQAATRRSLGVAVLMLAGCLGLWWLDHAYGRLAVAAVLAAVVGALAGVGRAVRPLPDTEPEQQPGEPGPDEPYPIADAHTRTEAADCVRRALAAQSIALRLAGEARRTAWGWEVAVVLRSGTPAGIVTKTAELETHLDLPAGGLLVTPDRTRRARVVLRLAERDPFTGIGPPPVRGLASITERAIIGQRIDGSPLAVPLLGVHGVVIGTSGAGKSTTLRTIADAATACADALVWDLDPAGSGLDALGAGIRRRERDPAGITDALADALALAEARPRMLAELGMGAAWIPSPTRPALVVIVDEYPRLTDRAKALAVALLRVGRKARVTLILAATEATSDTLGAAIADTTALRILHACRHTDIRLVLGPQMLADGWRPDRLHPATADDPGQAGRCYVATAGNREPLISAICPLDESDAHERGERRAAAGIPRIDPDSWAAARVLRRARNPESGAGLDPTDLPVSVDGQAITDVLIAFGSEPWLWTEDLLTALGILHGRYLGWSADDLATLLRPLGVSPVQIKRAGRNRNGYHRDIIADAWQRHQNHHHDDHHPPGAVS